MDDQDYQSAADLLRSNVRWERQIDGVLSIPISQIYRIFESDDFNVQGLNDMLAKQKEGLLEELRYAA